MPASDAEARLAQIPTQNALFTFLGAGRGFYRTGSAAGFKIWQSTYWVRGPAGGSVILEGRVEDLGGYSSITGQMHFGWQLAVSYVWLGLVAVSFAALGDAGFATLFGGLITVQALLLRVAAGRGRDRLVTKLSGLLSDPSGQPAG